MRAERLCGRVFEQAHALSTYAWLGLRSEGGGSSSEGGCGVVPAIS